MMKNIEVDQKESKEKRCLLTLDFRPYAVFHIIGQTKAFCRKRIQESSCDRKQAVDIDVAITSMNNDRKIMQPVRTTSGPSKKTRK